MLTGISIFYVLSSKLDSINLLNHIEVLYSTMPHFRISSYFNTMDPGEAARLIISGLRRNAAEISIPENALLYSKLLR